MKNLLKNKRRLLLEKCPNGIMPPENFFIDLCQDIDIVIGNEGHDKGAISFYKDTRYGFTTIFIKDGYLIPETNKKLWCSYEFYWKILFEEYKMNYEEILGFTAKIFIKHLNIKIDSSDITIMFF